MPNYEYKCPECNDSDGKALKFEVWLSYDDKSLVRCPKCKTVCRRLISSVPHYWKDGVPN